MINYEVVIMNGHYAAEGAALQLFSECYYVIKDIIIF